MKRKYLLSAVLLATVGCLLLWYAPHTKDQNVPEIGVASTNPIVAQPKLPPQSPTLATSSMAAGPPPNLWSDPIDWAKQRHQQMDAQQMALNDWRAPIEFYGKVVDENTNAVAGADVHFVWTDLSPEGSSERRTHSDDNGLFSLRGVAGKNLHVETFKQGYYNYSPSGLYFNYTGQAQNFVPDASNPVLFRLKSKGVVEPLIHVHAGRGGMEGIRITKDGTPVEISLRSGNAVPLGQGDIRVQCWTYDQGKRPGQGYDWKCQITVPGGGLEPRADDLDFEAPQDGYQPTDVIDMPAEIENRWSNDVKRQYFLKLGSGNYARINFEMIAHGDHFVVVESYYNPSGSRNLEPPD